MATKKGHFIPKAYSQHFADENGRVWVLPKHNLGEPRHLLPAEFGHQRYYYAQPKPDGERDTESLERLFSQLETAWPTIVRQWDRGDPAHEKIETIFQFLTLLRARVPALRDAIELMLSSQIKAVSKNLEKRGLLPQMPAGLGWDDIDVSIDPHQSIHAMIHVIKATGSMLGFLGFELVRNDTRSDYISSDNPVIWFDPNADESTMRPYAVRPGISDIEFLLPVSSRLLLRGHTDLAYQWMHRRLVIRRTGNLQEIRRQNQLIARFAYREIYASDRKNDPLWIKYRNVSPVLASDETPIGDENLLVSTFRFGGLPRKPKWKATSPAALSSSACTRS